jgi:uncharacterized metal-binding protein YceD (DUF177 family)
VSRFKQFTIPFTGLSVGEHQFDFEISDWFFENFEYSLIKKGDVKVDVVLTKQSTVLVFDFQIEGEVEVCCDLCADDFMIPISGDHRLIVKFGPEASEESDEIIVIPSGEYEIDISQYIYEYINLDIPLKRIHGENAAGESLCNPETLQKLKEIVKENKESKGDDPRWDALKNLN